MALIIREMRPQDADAKGFVHWKAWHETYPGLIDPSYLSRFTLERCQAIARSHPENTLVAELNGEIVGFACPVPCWDDPALGEIQAIYVLKRAQGLGIGRKLMAAALERLAGYETVVLWVLQGNAHAIGFYEHFGFRHTGTIKTVTLGTENHELQMVLHR